jgi:protein phosphatase methylesterase 1
MVCHHGAGYSALSFSKLAKEIAEETNGECGLLAIDARRHGTISYNARVVVHGI